GRRHLQERVRDGAAAEPPRLKVCIASDLTAHEDSIRGEDISKSGFETARRQSRHASRSASQAISPRTKIRFGEKTSPRAGSRRRGGTAATPPDLHRTRRRCGEQR